MKLIKKGVFIKIRLAYSSIQILFKIIKIRTNLCFQMRKIIFIHKELQQQKKYKIKNKKIIVLPFDSSSEPTFEFVFSISGKIISTQSKSIPINNQSKSRTAFLVEVVEINKHLFLFSLY